MTRRRGKNFEELVASFEKFAKTKNLQIKSPEYIVGKISRKRREIDVTLRGTIGSTSVFVAIECRERKKAQGIVWIEEIISKKKDIGADIMIAVSSSKFTSGAVRSAQSAGVLLRYIKSFNPDELELWFGTAEVEIETRSFEVKPIKMLLLNYDPQKDQALSHLRYENDSLFYSSRNNKKVNLVDFVNGTPIKDHIQFGTDSAQFKKEKCIIEFIGENPPYYIKGKTKRSFIKQITFEMKLIIKKAKAPLINISSYSNALTESPIMSSANFKAKVGKDEFTIRLIKDEKTGDQKVLADSTAQIKLIKVKTNKIDL